MNNKRKTTIFHSASIIMEDNSNSKKPSLNKIVESAHFDEEEDEVHVKKVSTIQKEDVKDIARMVRYRLK